MSLSQEPLHSVVWKGAKMGDFTAAQIQQKLSLGEISRMHRVWSKNNWISVGEFVDAKRVSEIDQAAAQAKIREQQIRTAYEEKLRQARANEESLETQLQKIRNSAAQAAPTAPVGSVGRSPEQISPHWEHCSAPLGGTLGHLQCLNGPDVGMTIRLDGNPVSFGSSSGCAILSRDPSVAAQLVNMYVTDGKLCLTRVSPAGVVIVNGVSIGQSDLLANGCQLQLGSSFWQFESFSLDAQIHSGGLADAVSRLVGVDSIGGFSFSETFSHVFKTHSDEETELNLACGTTSTTPPLELISPAFPQPWMFIRTLALSLGVFWLLKFSYSEVDQNPVLIPGLILLGSAATPLSLLVLFFEVNKPRNVSIYQLVKLVLGGGALAMLITSLLNPVVIPFFVEKLYADPKKLDWSDLAWTAGPVEESAKMLALLWVVNKRRYEWTLNGLLFGAAVGTGFAILETCGYAFLSLTEGPAKGVEAMFSILLLRGLLASFSMHVVWSAIVGAGLWRAKRGRPFEISILASRLFVGPFLVAVSLHALWNSPLSCGGFVTKILLVSSVGWIVVIGLIREGLREIAGARYQALHDPGQKPSAQY